MVMMKSNTRMRTLTKITEAKLRQTSMLCRLYQKAWLPLLGKPVLRGLLSFLLVEAVTNQETPRVIRLEETTSLTARSVRVQRHLSNMGTVSVTTPRAADSTLISMNLVGWKRKRRQEINRRRRCSTCLLILATLTRRIKRGQPSPLGRYSARN
uniref:Uncharacterized protein n=1 Tax=Cacopsylla melanoneura TaxID=428564 RepID=A0A8D8YPC4_9HEMI